MGVAEPRCMSRYTKAENSRGGSGSEVIAYEFEKTG
jgi:hypothetical protein